MLGPFRIRNLRRSASPPNRASYFSPSRRGSLGAVVSITDTEYDYNTSLHPESKLLYLDEDDGEIVTTGSSFELAQRLDDPVPIISNSRTRRESAKPVSGSASTPLQAASADMHIFEIDRRGESVRIWEEIEQRTKSLRATQATSQPQLALTSINPPKNPDQDRKTHKAHSETTEGLRTISYQSPSLPRERQYEDEWGEQLHESEDTPRLQDFQESRTAVSEGRNTLTENFLEHQRERYFQATNPPKLSETGGSANLGAHHTGMRLSDVLNDDNEAREAAHETEPLHMPYCNGILTEEGKRQAMEVGKRFRLRKWTYPASQIKPQGSARTQSPYDNRWASYNNIAPEPVNSDDSRHETPADKPDPQRQDPVQQLPTPQEPEGSLLQAFRAELAKIVSPRDQSEEKLPAHSVDSKPERKGSQTVPVHTQAAHAPNSSTSTFKLLLQAINSMCSNVTTLNSQLRHQLTDTIPVSRMAAQSNFDVRGACLDFVLETDHVIHEILQEELDSDVTLAQPVQETDADLLANGVQCLRKVATEFERLRDRLMASNAVRQQGDYHHGLDLGRPTNLVIDPIPQWAQARDVVKYVRTCDGRLADIASSLLSVDVVYPVNSRLPAAVCVIRPDGSASKWRSLLTSKMWDGLLLNVNCSLQDPFLSDKHGRQVIGQHETPLKHHIPGEIGSDGLWKSTRPVEYRPVSILERSQQPTARRDAPAYELHQHSAGLSTTEIDDSSREEEAATGLEHLISYRHVPSPMPWTSADPPRGRPLFDPLFDPLSSFSSEFPYEKVVQTTANDLQSKRRSMPTMQARRGSRSRSRSPVANDPGIKPDKQNYSPPRSSCRLTPWPQSYDPLRRSSIRSRRQGQVDDNPPEPRHLKSALRPFASTNNMHHDYTSCRYQPLSRQRSTDGATGVRFANTVVHTLDDSSHGRYRNHVRNRVRSENTTASALRHSKSLGSVRKPHSIQSGYQYNGERERTAPNTSGTLEEPFDDQLDHNTKLPAQASLGLETGAPNVAPPDSPLVPTRFPTLEQFEGKHKASVPQFPPLPSMEPLVPDRPNASKTDNKAHDNLDLPFAKATDPTSAKAYESAWPQYTSKAAAESSGDFFRRMTGLAEPPQSPVRPASPICLSPAAPGARLIKPFDPLAETATIHRHQLIEGVRRSATVTGLRDRYTSTNRRPYSAYFDGNGRVEWDQFIQGNRSNDRVMVQNRNGTSQRHSVQRARSERIPHSTQAFVSEATLTHQDATTVGAVQLCVEELKKLGYGRQEDGGVTRLVVYAQAAEGNLEDAIDMIDEERKAWEERTG